MPLKVNTSGDVPELLVYDEIGPAWAGMIDAMSVVEALAQIGNAEEIVVRINSPGGDVFQAIPIIDELERHSARIITEATGLAASAASYLFNAGDVRRIVRNGELMIHQAWTLAFGNSDDIESVAKALRDVDGAAIDEYTARAGDKSSREEIEAWLKAETWMNATEAVDRGFADEIIDRKEAVAAKVAKGRYRNTPRKYLDSRTWEQQLRAIAATARHKDSRQTPATRAEGANQPSDRSRIAARVAFRRKQLGL